MSEPVLRTAYDKSIAEGITPGYWEMSDETRILFKLDGQDFCGLPTNSNPSLPLGEWFLYPADQADPLWKEFLAAMAVNDG